MDSDSKITRLYRTENIITEEVTEKLDVFQARFTKVDEFGWWDFEQCQTDSGMQFIYRNFQERLSLRGLKITLEAPDHQEMNGQVEVSWRTLRTIAHSIMVNARVLEEYIYFALMYTSHHIFIVLPINHLIKQEGELTTPHKLATGTGYSVSNLGVIYIFHVLYEN